MGLAALRKAGFGSCSGDVPAPGRAMPRCCIHRAGAERDGLTLLLKHPFHAANGRLRPIWRASLPESRISFLPSQRILHYQRQHFAPICFRERAWRFPIGALSVLAPITLLSGSAGKNFRKVGTSEGNDQGSFGGNASTGKSAKYRFEKGFYCSPGR